MSVWTRTTRKLLPESIPAEVRNAIESHLESFNLGPILGDYLTCIETTSSRQRKGLFGGGVLGMKIPRHTVQISVVTPLWLVTGIRSEKEDSAAALSVPLEDATVEDYQDTPDYNLIPDCGVYVTGIFTGRVGTNGNQQIRYFIGLGEEAAASEFKDILFHAIQLTRKRSEGTG